MKVMVDNVAVLGIEFSLLERLSGLLSSDVVMNLDHSVVEEIAAEKEDSRLERARALSKLQTLEAALHTVRHYGRHKLEGENVSAIMVQETHINVQSQILTLAPRSTAMNGVLRTLV